MKISKQDFNCASAKKERKRISEGSALDGGLRIVRQKYFADFLAKYFLIEILRWMERLFCITSNYRAKSFQKRKQAKQSPRRNDADIILHYSWQISLLPYN